MTPLQELLSELKLENTDALIKYLQWFREQDNRAWHNQQLINYCGRNNFWIIVINGSMVEAFKTSIGSLDSPLSWELSEKNFVVR